VVVIVALVFLVYVLSSITPEEVEHKITNKGVIFAGKEYFWNQLIRFWFTNRFGTDLLIIETTRIPGRLELVVDNKHKAEVRRILEEHLENEEANPNFMDKAASWLSRRLPLEG
jgi:predicted HTH transcriptional regulator